MWTYTKRPLVLLMAAALSSSYAAEDEQKKQPKKSQLDDEVVVITATKIKTELMETPVAVTALSQSQLNRSGVTDARDIGNLVPNMDVSFSPSDSGVQMTMRGVSSNNFTELGDPSVGFHVDGVYSPRPQGAMALMYDLERLEVLRGPQGTLYGRNATAGSVNLITKDPDFNEQTTDILFELGNYNQQQLRATVNLPITGNFALRANYFIERRDGYIDQYMDVRDSNNDGIADVDQRRNYAVSDADEYTNSDRYGMRITGLWDIAEDFEARFAFERFQDNSAGGYIAPDCKQSPEACAYFGGDERTVWVNTPGEMDMTIDSFRAKLSYYISEDVQLVYNAGWAYQERSQQWDGDMGWFPTPGDNTGWGWSGYLYTPWGDDLYLATRWSDYKSISHELQLQGSYEDKINWIVGYFNFSEDNAIHFDVELPFCCGAPTPGAGTFIQPERLLDSEALFTQATFHWSEALHFTLGYRTTTDRKRDIGGTNWGAWGPWSYDANGNQGSFSGGAFGPNEGIDWGIVGTPGAEPTYTSDDLLPGMGTQDYANNLVIVGYNDTSHKWTKGTWRVGVDYDLDADNYLYSYVATGYKAGGFGDGIDVDGLGTIQFFGYAPEELTNYEVGYKGVLLDEKLNLTVAAFISDYDDKQVTTYRKVGEHAITGQDISTLLTENAAKASIKGLEVEFSWRLSEQDKLSGNFAFLDATYDEWTGYSDGWYCAEREAAGASVCGDQGQGDVSGNKLPYTPEFSWTINYERVFELEGDGQITTWLSVHWEDESHLTDRNFDELAAYSDVRDAWHNINASVRYDTGKDWYVEAYIYNATDELVKTWSNGGVQYPKWGWNSPRMFGIRYSAEF
ncbi:MAG: TonB-dependent receptor [Gammaproteobacteria bacterium]|nr:TonB-dependent receptor [Gammaproteobacteria bacterium]